MLDLKWIREHPDDLRVALRDRGMTLDLDGLLRLDQDHRRLLTELEGLRHHQHEASTAIARLKSAKRDAKTELVSVKVSSQKIKSIETKVGEISKKLADIEHRIPNIPLNSVPKGGKEANRVVREWGEKAKKSTNYKNHIELCKLSAWIDFPRAAKMTGSNFPLFVGEGARLVRALVNFMVDLHVQEGGYREVWPPALVNRASMYATGQLPNLEADMYRLKDDDYFLIPTAEVPVTNLHRDEVLEASHLPLKYVAYSPCFRREAGSYGKETKGLIRVHQFDKVELVIFTAPEQSEPTLEHLVTDAERVLQRLGLHYRVVLLASGDLSFSAAKCYDIEVWAPGTQQYLEVSSCSTFGDFQARRARIRYRHPTTNKPALVHTLNGSGIALARTIVALLETYQQPDGSVALPACLRPYLGPPGTSHAPAPL